MQKRLLLTGAAIAGFLLGCAAANAQAGYSAHGQGVFEAQVAAPAPGQQVQTRQVFIRGGAPGLPVEFMGAEFGVGDKVVKGAPYMADAVTESVQTLADGNRITHRTSSAIARDSEGRTRRDLAFPVLKGVAADHLPKISVIYDPVAKTSYTLDHNQKIARKMEGYGMAVRIEDKETLPAGAPAVRHEAADVVVARAPVAVLMRRPAENSKEESLGKRTIEGVVAEGTRTVQVIPAGEVGNERPIEIVSERWYSPELQTVVMTRHSDPRTGETTYKLTNLRRGEPLRSLFEVPSDYTIKTDELEVIRRKVAPRE